LGLPTRRVRRPVDLDGLAGIVLPGGESTTLSMLLESSGLFDPLSEALSGGLPAFGTCAGLILLASRVQDGRPDQRSFDVLDVTARRNGYGPQRYSFEAEVAPAGPLDGPPLPAVFIRAPVVLDVGPSVEVLGTLHSAEGPRPVAVRSGPVLAATFHPELTADRRLHRLFGAMTEAATARR
jgi:5'-phosphate synthase pdxT subunit